MIIKHYSDYVKAINEGLIRTLDGDDAIEYLVDRLLILKNNKVFFTLNNFNNIQNNRIDYLFNIISSKMTNSYGWYPVNMHIEKIDGEENKLPYNEDYLKLKKDDITSIKIEFDSKFDDIDESYLDSNFAPLYHHTTTHSFYNIMSENILKTSEIEHPFKSKKVKMVSLTRNSNLDISYFKAFLDVVIELDRNKLNKKYKIIPYDFFIHTKKEILPKSNIKREKEYEFEEIIPTDIKNISEYIISINFKDDSIMDRQVASILPTLKDKNIIIYNNGKLY